MSNLRSQLDTYCRCCMRTAISSTLCHYDEWTPVCAACASTESEELRGMIGRWRGQRYWRMAHSEGSSHNSSVESPVTEVNLPRGQCRDSNLGYLLLRP